MSLRLHGIEHLSPSGASTLVDCERRYWWRYKHKLGKDERSEATAMGGGLATALEFGSLEKGLAEYHERRPRADGWTDPVAYEREKWAAEATIIWALTHYAERWPDPPGFIREQTYLVRMPNVERVIQARVDGCMPKQYLVEDKLRSASSMRADALENEVRQGRQLTAEIYAHWKTTGELLPVHFRVTKKCDPRKWKKLDTQVQVSDVIEEHFEGDGVFNEFYVTRTEAQLEEFHAEFLDLLLDADRVLSNPAPNGRRNTDSCHKYGRTCPALAVCQGLRGWQDLVTELEESK